MLVILRSSWFTLQLLLLRRAANLPNNYALVADELGHALYGELDYRHEASNAAESATAHKHVLWMYVPKILPH
jgi:aarF domain-containing kinase